MRSQKSHLVTTRLLGGIGLSAGGVVLASALLSISVTIAQEIAAPPGAGLKSNHNYYLYNAGKPIPGLVVSVELTQAVVCDDVGFHVQLNANSPIGSPVHWQQYVMGFNPDFKDHGRSTGAVVGASIEYFAHPNSFNTADKNPPNIARLHDLPGPRTLPAGAKFIIAMQYDGDDISAADFTYVEKDGKERHNWTIQVPPPSPPYPGPAISKSAVRTPIIAFQVDIVGRNSGDTAVMQSGEGKILYSSSAPMTVVAKRPLSQGQITAEKANSVYSELPASPSASFTQTFTVHNEE